jgi:hypothetical protein
MTQSNKTESIFTELLPAQSLKTNAYCYVVNLEDSNNVINSFTCCVLCTCCDVAREVIKQSYPEAMFERLCVSDVLLQHNGVVLVDVESTVLSIDDENTTVESIIETTE